MIRPKDRVYQILSHHETWPVPAQVTFESEEMLNTVLSHYGVRTLKELGLQLIAHTRPNEPVEDLRNDTYRDYYGCIWRKGFAPQLLEPPLKGPCLGRYHFPDFSQKDLYSAIPGFAQLRKDEFILVNAYYFGLLERAWALCGFEAFFIYLVTEEKFVMELVDHLHQQALQSIGRLLTMDIDAINCGPGDAGGQRGLLLSPQLWRKYFRKPWREEIEMIKRAGKIVYTHSCGDNTALMDDYVDLGVDILNPLQPEAMDVRAIKKRYGSRTAFHGGIGTQHILYGTSTELRHEIRETIEVLAKGGGYIAEPAKAVPANVPMENALALVESLIEQGRPQHSCS